MTLCSIDDCDRPRYRREWCSPHYQRWEAHGDPLAGGPYVGEVAATFERLAALETDDCVIWPHATAGKYGELKFDGVVQSTHVVVLTRRVGPRPTGHIAAHGPCHNPRCMNYRHLRWATHAENQADRRRDGTHLDGERCPARKLTEAEVREIRSLLGTMPQAAIATRFGVSSTTIRNIAIGATWKGPNPDPIIIEPPDKETT